jgi:hypothetical protein
VSLPYKLSAQPASVQKAYKRFTQFYGQREGERIFLAFADERGTGNTQRQRALSVFKKGSHL